MESSVDSREMIILNIIRPKGTLLWVRKKVFLDIMANDDLTSRSLKWTYYSTGVFLFIIVYGYLSAAVHIKVFEIWPPTICVYILHNIFV